MSLEDPDRKGCFIVNCTTEYLPTHQDFLSEVLQNKANFNTIVSQALERGKQNGEFSSDLNLDETASFIFTFLSGLKVTSKVEQSSSALKRMIGVALKVLH
jgi:TetR/AcrR family transcriptional repressor of nem operon